MSVFGAGIAIGVFALALLYAVAVVAIVILGAWCAVDAAIGRWRARKGIDAELDRILQEESRK